MTKEPKETIDEILEQERKKPSGKIHWRSESFGIYITGSKEAIKTNKKQWYLLKEIKE